MADSSGALEGSTLHQLLSDDENQLLDTIDELRSQGIGRLLEEEGLPQLIVCGDQSSGKSSVLEALTHVRFPTKSTVCTTFPTELRLRREKRSRVSCRIKASASRTPEQKEHLARFQESFDTPEKFPELIIAARNCMSKCPQSNSNAFFEDILEVEIVGPKLAPLTIVDLPGLIHYRSSSSGEHDIKLVKDLVQGYMKKSNSIILAVVSAHNDINNQIVLSHIKDIVPDGNRTLGIITKPDELPSGSEKEQEYLDYAHTNPSKFHYGWHVVRNRTYEEQTSTAEERDTKEMAFFRDSNWNSLPRREVGLGIDGLRQKLSKMLLDHINMSLPSIMQRLEEDLQRSESELSRLGDTRSTAKDQLNYLSDISEDFSEYTKDALDGRYHRKSFFGERMSPQDLGKRLRANVRNLNDEFVDRMLREGHKWHVVEDSKMRSPLFRSQQLGHPNIIEKSAFLKEHVDMIAYHERAQELPGLSNPLLVSSLFHEQSEPWENIATAHLDTVWEAVKSFLEALLGHLSDERTCNQLLIHVIDPAMERRRQALKAKLQELLTPHKHDPISVDPHFARKILSYKQENITRSIIESVRQKGIANNSSMLSVDDITASIAAVDTLVDDKYGSRQTYEFMSAYYEMTILVFINNIVSLAIEQCLLSGLPKIFSSTTIREMSDEKLGLIASESRDTRMERERLSERAMILQKGVQTLRRIHPSNRARHLAAKSTPIANVASGNSGPKQTGHTAVHDTGFGTHSTASTMKATDTKSNNASSLAGISPSVYSTPLSTRLASDNTFKKTPSSGDMYPAANSSGLFPTSSPNSTIPASTTAGPKTSKGPIAKFEAPAASIFVTSDQSKPTAFNLFGASSQATPTTGGLFGGLGNPTSTGASSLGTSIGAAAAIQRPFGGFGQGAGQGLFGAPAQSGGGSLFGSASQPAAATTGGFGSAKSKSPDSKGMDTELLLIDDHRDGRGKDQFQFLSSHIPKNKSFEELRLEDYAYISRRPLRYGFH